MSNETPVIRCGGCNHPIDMHTAVEGHQTRSAIGCTTMVSDTVPCICRATPNTIAVGAIYAALTEGLTPAAPRPVRVSRQPDGSWS